MTGTSEGTYIDLLPVIVEREGATLPDGFDRWGLKSVHPDLRTYGGYRWPFPGGVAVTEGVNIRNSSACPSRRGDGLCVATTWAGMASGGIPARTLLLVATSSDDVLGSLPKEGKSRHRRVAVVALVDGERLLREAGAGANLYGARLDGASLRGANLVYARLYNASLRGANLTGANLFGANLTGANLFGASLFGASLRGARLTGHDKDDLRERGAIL